MNDIKNNTDIEKLDTKIENSEKSVKAYQYFIIRLIIFILVLWILFFQVIGIIRMPTEDMYPRIDLGDTLLIYRLDKNVADQDIIVIEKETPDSEGKKNMYVLRVIATEGDTVEITEDRLLINGHAVIESNIFYETFRYDGFTEYPITLKKDECFVLADRRNGGEDSRYFGIINKKDIVGTVITIIRRSKL